jgi:DNA repair protein RadD
MQLRPYQQAAVDAVYHHLRTRDDNPCVSIPTAGGKSIVMAQMAKDAVERWGGRVVILAHVKELLEQTADKVKRLCRDLVVGVYSAGLKRRDTEEPVIIAGIQSVYQRACDLGPFDLVIVDEAHMIPPDGEGMYRTFLADAKVVNPRLRVIGLTATPFRMRTGTICTPDGILNHICYEIGVRDLIDQGYLCPLVSKTSRTELDVSKLHVRAGEFIAGETEALMDTTERIDAACAEIMRHTRDRSSVLVFCSGVKHGRHLAQKLRSLGAEVETVFGETLDFVRDEVLDRFRQGDLKYVVNMDVLTTGFDAPNIDCVALLRPTLSPGLYYQMVGRGFRLAEGKENCLILDFGGNILRHGPVDRLSIPGSRNGKDRKAPLKICPECDSVVLAGVAICPDCGFEFPERERRPHEPKASTEDVLSGPPKTTTYAVAGVEYSVHTKFGADPEAPKTLRVDYRIGLYGKQSEWICVEHDGYAREKAEAWWRRRSRTPCPRTAEEAVALARNGVLAPTIAIRVRSAPGEKYDRITGYELGEVLPSEDELAEQRVNELLEKMGIGPDEVPF